MTAVITASTTSRTTQIKKNGDNMSRYQDIICRNTDAIGRIQMCVATIQWETIPKSDTCVASA